MVGTGRFELPKARLRLAPLADWTGGIRWRYCRVGVLRDRQRGLHAATSFEVGEEINGRDGQI